MGGPVSPVASDVPGARPTSIRCIHTSTFLRNFR